MTATNISVSPEVRSMLPEVLIDYLWNLALTETYRKHAVQTFKLIPAKLSGRGILDIFHVDEKRRVFGIDPLRCTLCVLYSEDHYQMILSK